jgi:hypothetical protein
MQASEWSLCLGSATKLTARGFYTSSVCPAPAKNSGNQKSQADFSWALLKPFGRTQYRGSAFNVSLPRRARKLPDSDKTGHLEVGVFLFL